MIVFCFVFCGFLGGILAGMGMGGGTLLIPLLTTFFNVNQKLAQLTNLIAFLPTAIVVSFSNIKHKKISFKNAMYIIIPGCISSVCFALFAVDLKSNVLSIIFGTFLIFIGLYSLYDIFKKK